MNGFRSRLVNESLIFSKRARRSWPSLLALPPPGPAPSPQHRGRLGGCASAVAAGDQHAPGLLVELRQLLAFSDVSLPGAITDSAAFRWRNHVLNGIGLATAQRRLCLIDAFYEHPAFRPGGAQPFASLPPLRASSLPPRPLNLSSCNGSTMSAAAMLFLVRWLGLRPRKRRSCGRWIGPRWWHPVLRIHSGRLAQPLPADPRAPDAALAGNAGSSEVPSGLIQRLSRRSYWPAVGPMGCSAPALQRHRVAPECARQWRQHGVSEAGAPAAGAGNSARMHCPTTTQPAVCA